MLNKEPTDPANLRAYLVDGSEDTEGGYYRTKLTWDSSMFETNYELELSTYPDDGTSTSPAKTVYGFYETETATEKNFAGSLIRYDGSLVSGSHECTLKLELGKVYEVKLRARNYIGESNWVERNVADVTTSHAGYTFIDFPTMTDPKKHINRRRIRYHLNVGMDISFIKVEFNGLSPANEYTDMECTAYFTSASSLGVSQVTFKSEPDGKSCKFSTATYPTRTFVLMVSAYNASHTRLSRTFLIDLRN